MIDADVASYARPCGEFGLDGAGRRHDGLIRKQRLAYFLVTVAPAGCAEQGGVFFSTTKFTRCDQATLPEPTGLIARAGLVSLEAFGGCEREA